MENGNLSRKGKTLSSSDHSFIHPCSALIAILQEINISNYILLILKSMKGRDVSFFEFGIGTGRDTAQPAVRFIPFPLLYISICSVSWCLLFSCTEMNFIRNEYKMSKIDYKTYSCYNSSIYERSVRMI